MGRQRERMLERFREERLPAVRAQRRRSEAARKAWIRRKARDAKRNASGRIPFSEEMEEDCIFPFATATRQNLIRALADAEAALPRKAGEIFGVPIYEDPTMPDDVIEFHNSRTGKTGKIVNLKVTL